MYQWLELQTDQLRLCCKTKEEKNYNDAGDIDLPQKTEWHRSSFKLKKKRPANWMVFKEVTELHKYQMIDNRHPSWLILNFADYFFVVEK